MTEKLHTQSDLDTLLAKMECGHHKVDWVQCRADTDGDCSFEGCPQSFGSGHCPWDVDNGEGEEHGVCAACLRESQLLAKLVQVVVERAAELFIQERLDWHKSSGIAPQPGTERGCACYGDDKTNSHASGCPRRIAAKIRQLSSPENREAMIAEAKGGKMSHPDFVNKGNALGKFIEECGEALAAAGKTVRFGYSSFDPTKPEGERERNEDWLCREIADLEEAIARLKKERDWPTEAMIAEARKQAKS